MSKKLIRLTESDLKNIVKKSVGNILREAYQNLDYYEDSDFADSDLMDNDYVPSASDLEAIEDNDYDIDDEDLFDDSFNYNNDYTDLDFESKRMMGRIIKESINKVLNEGAKSVDPNNVVPQELAKKYMFAREYVDKTNGLEIWGKNITGNNFFNRKRGPHDYSPQELLYALKIKRFTDILKLPGGKTRVRITVEGDPKSGMRTPWGNNRPRKIGDYVDTEWADKDGAIFHNPNNGHVKRINQEF